MRIFLIFISLSSFLLIEGKINFNVIKNGVSATTNGKIQLSGSDIIMIEICRDTNFQYKTDGFKAKYFSMDYGSKSYGQTPVTSNHFLRQASHKIQFSCKELQDYIKSKVKTHEVQINPNHFIVEIVLNDFFYSDEKGIILKTQTRPDHRTLRFIVDQ